MITKQQIIIAQTLLSKCNLRAQKANVLLGFSDGRTEHVNELEEKEAAELITFLQRKARDMDRTPRALWTDRMKRKIISMAHELGWKLPNGKINMKSVNGWCVKYGYLHKRLDEYKYRELHTLVQQFEQMYLVVMKRK